MNKYNPKTLEEPKFFHNGEVDLYNEFVQIEDVPAWWEDEGENTLDADIGGIDGTVFTSTLYAIKIGKKILYRADLVEMFGEADIREADENRARSMEDN